MLYYNKYCYDWDMQNIQQDYKKYLLSFRISVWHYRYIRLKCNISFFIIQTIKYYWKRKTIGNLWHSFLMCPVTSRSTGTSCINYRRGNKSRWKRRRWEHRWLSGCQKVQRHLSGTRFQTWLMPQWLTKLLALQLQSFPTPNRNGQKRSRRIWWLSKWPNLQAQLQTERFQNRPLPWPWTRLLQLLHFNWSANPRWKSGSCRIRWLSKCPNLQPQLQPERFQIRPLPRSGTRVLQLLLYSPNPSRRWCIKQWGSSRFRRLPEHPALHSKLQQTEFRDRYLSRSEPRFLQLLLEFLYQKLRISQVPLCMESCKNHGYVTRLCIRPGRLNCKCSGLTHLWRNLKDIY